MRPVLPQPVGEVKRRGDRPDRLAFYIRHDVLNTTFAADQTMEDVRAILAQAGYRLDADGVVWAA